MLDVFAVRQKDIADARARGDIRGALRLALTMGQLVASEIDRREGMWEQLTIGSREMLAVNNTNAAALKAVNTPGLCSHQRLVELLDCCPADQLLALYSRLCERYDQGRMPS